MKIQAAEELLLDEVIGTRRLVRIKIDQYTKEDTEVYEYLEWEFDVNDSEEYVNTRAAKLRSSAYKELRAAAYPSMADYLDAVVKGDIVAQQEYIDACLAVKVKYPKNELEVE